MAEHSRPDLGSMLRHEAERHLPDRDAMLTRIVQRRSQPARGRWAGLRPVAAAASVVATLVVGFTGIRLLGDGPEPDPAPAATTGPSPSPSVSASSRTPKAEPDGKAGDEADDKPGGEPKEPRKERERIRQPADAFLGSSAVLDPHSNSTWAQGNVTLTTTATITALDMEVNVARTAGVADAGKWSSVPADMITTVVTEEKDRLVYRFTLKQGTLAPGEYVFAVQYTHAVGPRDPGADMYGVVATAGGEEAVVSGAFQ